MSLAIEERMDQVLAELQKQTSLLEQIATQNLALIEALADEGMLILMLRPRPT